MGSSEEDCVLITTKHTKDAKNAKILLFLFDPKIGTFVTFAMFVAFVV